MNMSNTAQTVQTEKKKISFDDFEKKVQIEMEHLVYFDRMKRPEAEAQAKRVVSEKFVVA